MDLSKLRDRTSTTSHLGTLCVSLEDIAPHTKLLTLLEDNRRVIKTRTGQAYCAFSATLIAFSFFRNHTKKCKLK